jgi:hypothetical protein
MRDGAFSTSPSAPNVNDLMDAISMRRMRIPQLHGKALRRTRTTDQISSWDFRHAPTRA